MCNFKQNSGRFDLLEQLHHVGSKSQFKDIKGVSTVNFNIIINLYQCYIAFLPNNDLKTYI